MTDLKKYAELLMFICLLLAFTGCGKSKEMLSSNGGISSENFSEGIDDNMQTTDTFAELYTLDTKRSDVICDSVFGDHGRLIFPVWWYELLMPVWTFLEEDDLSGKTVIPFFSHNGSPNGANRVDRVAELAKGATVRTEDVLSLRGSSVAGC